MIISPELLILAFFGMFALAIACLFGWRLVLPLAVLILGALVLILPNGALLIGGGVAVLLVLGTLYIVFKFGGAGVHVAVDCGDGPGDRYVNVEVKR